MVASIFDQFPVPSASQLLGWHVPAVDPKAGTIEVGFVADDRFLNPAGNVQGGFLAAMLDDTIGSALFAMTEGVVYAPTIDLNVSFIKPALPGLFRGKGRAVSLGKTIVFLEGELFDQHESLVARATASSRAMSGDKAKNTH